MAETDKIRDKLRKLLALSQSNNEHEAALAMSMAQKIAMEHDLDLHEVKPATERQTAWVRLRKGVSQRYYDHLYISNILAAVAEFCPIHVVSWGASKVKGKDKDGNTIFVRDRSKVIDMGFGTAHEGSIELAKELFEYLDREVGRRYKMANRLQDKNRTPMEKWTFKRGFMIGATNALIFNARKVAAERRAQTVTSVSTGRSLVVGDWLQQERDMLAELMKKASITQIQDRAQERKIGVAEMVGLMHGKKAGSEIGLEPQIKAPKAHLSVR